MSKYFAFIFAFGFILLSGSATAQNPCGVVDQTGRTITITTVSEVVTAEIAGVAGSESLILRRQSVDGTILTREFPVVYQLNSFMAVEIEASNPIFDVLNSQVTSTLSTDVAAVLLTSPLGAPNWLGLIYNLDKSSPPQYTFFNLFNPFGGIGVQCAPLTPVDGSLPEAIAASAGIPFVGGIKDIAFVPNVIGQIAALINQGFVALIQSHQGTESQYLSQINDLSSQIGQLNGQIVAGNQSISSKTLTLQSLLAEAIKRQRQIARALSKNKRRLGSQARAVINNSSKLGRNLRDIGATL